MRSCLVRNPDASLPKIYKGKSGALEGQHNKGCNCKRSGCLKNYCVCYEANISCTFSCKCVDCKNCVADLADKTFSGNARGRGPVPVITPGVVEAVVGCLLVLAEEAEWEQRCEAWAQHVLLNEFGHCLTQIVNAMFKTYAQ
ncbi:spexin prohormone 2 [Eucyclogobius newberryi]|uniref:spexin prohormone 2 n=1 Tax=Eucyclogobius newberryi TaxID=166745 RepID=UPI003B5B3601